ncbi:unnamed protein product, partial [Allacma fusca]
KLNFEKVNLNFSVERDEKAEVIIFLLIY